MDLKDRAGWSAAEKRRNPAPVTCWRALTVGMELPLSQPGLEAWTKLHCCCGRGFGSHIALCLLCAVFRCLLQNGRVLSEQGSSDFVLVI